MTLPAPCLRKARELVETLTPAVLRACARVTWTSGVAKQQWRYACGYVGPGGGRAAAHLDHHRTQALAFALTEAQRDAFHAGYRAAFNGPGRLSMLGFDRAVLLKRWWEQEGA